jgi:hypothetical protein
MPLRLAGMLQRAAVKRQKKTPEPVNPTPAAPKPAPDRAGTPRNSEPSGIDHRSNPSTVFGGRNGTLARWLANYGAVASER